VEVDMKAMQGPSKKHTQGIDSSQPPFNINTQNTLFLNKLTSFLFLYISEKSILYLSYNSTISEGGGGGGDGDGSIGSISRESQTNNTPVAPTTIKSSLILLSKMNIVSFHYIFRCINSVDIMI
jgi:hypothetical protein